MSVTRSATVVAVLFFFFCILTLIWIMEKELECDSVTLKLLILLFVCSSPFLFMLERGNMVILSLVGCMFFVCYYDSDIVYLRYFAFIALALAASLKIYPAVLGLLVLREKKGKNVLWLLCCGFIVFLFPFFFFGGLQDIISMLENSFSLSNETLSNTRGFGYGFKINIQNMFAMLGDYTGFHFEAAASVIVVILVVLLTAVSFVCEEKWKRTACLSLLLVIIPTFSWIYNAIYMLPSFVLFLKDKGDYRDRKSVVLLLLFMGIYLPLPYGELFAQLEGMNKMSISTMVCAMSAYLMAGLLIFDGVKSFLSKRV